MMNIESLKNMLQQILNPSLGIYVHIPFCRVRCQFCAFYVQVYQEDHVQAFLRGLHKEIHVYGQEVDLGSVPITSVYFGGGTPTVLSARQLVDVLSEIQKHFIVAPDAEISIEAHPGTINTEDLRLLHLSGFNRLSIGAQSFNDQELLQLGGRSMSWDTHKAMESARQAGFENISVDLMYGFPGHTHESWKQTLDATVRLKPQHLSCYAFTVEENSHFHEKVECGTASPPDEAIQSRLGLFAREYLGLSGYEQYEISNFCQPGFSCRHNRRYWQGESYLGVGPSAQSFVSGVRFGNQSDLVSYSHALTQDQLPIDEWEMLNLEEMQRERIVFGLRTMQGVSNEDVQSCSQIDPLWKNALKDLKKQGLLTEKEGYVCLTDKGIQFADTVAVTLL